MKKLILVNALTILAAALHAQTNTFPSSGSVGIGTTTPTNNLDVIGSVSIGSGTVNANSTKLFIRNPAATGKTWVLSSGLNAITESSFGIYNWSDNTAAPYLGITSTGNVGIGTFNPKAYMDIGYASNNVLASILARLPEGNGNGDGTYLGVRAINTQPVNSSSFSIEHKFNNTLNSSINFYRGAAYTGGFMTFSTNDGTERMRIDPNGLIGIGTTSPIDKLHVIGSVSANTSNSATTNGVTINGGNTNTAGSANVNRLRFGGNDVNANYFTIQGMSNVDYLTINNGNVGIGTTDTKGHKLAVNGSAIFTKAVVKSFGAWPDYVFENDYQLMSLDSVENFIQANKHLPNVPSAGEVNANGVDLGENQKILLQKTEELTLYLIEQDKKIKTQSEVNANQSKQIEELKLLVKQQQAQLELLLNKLKIDQ